MPARNPIVKRWLFSSWFAFCAGMGLLTLALNVYEHERFIPGIWGVLLLAGNGLGCWRTWHLRTSNEIRVLSAALAFVFGLLSLRAVLFLYDLFLPREPMPNGIGQQIDLFFTTAVIAGLGALGALVWWDLAPTRKRPLLAQRIGINPLVRPNTRHEQELQDSADEARDLAEDTNERVRNVQGIVHEEIKNRDDAGNKKE